MRHLGKASLFPCVLFCRIYLQRVLHDRNRFTSFLSPYKSTGRCFPVWDVVFFCPHFLPSLLIITGGTGFGSVSLLFREIRCSGNILLEIGPICLSSFFFVFFVFCNYAFILPFRIETVEDYHRVPLFYVFYFFCIGADNNGGQGRGASAIYFF